MGKSLKDVIREYPGKKPGTLGARTRIRLGVMDRMFHRLGGEEKYGKWCEKHQDFFYEEYTKMLIKERIAKLPLNANLDVKARIFRWIDDPEGETNKAGRGNSNDTVQAPSVPEGTD